VSVATSHFFIFVVGILLAGCAASETRSIVSKSDLPANRYKKIAVFIEDQNPKSSSNAVNMAVGPIVIPIHTPSGSAQTAEIEQKVVSALRSAGVDARNGPALFNGQKLNERDKAGIVQKNFDAVLYVNILVNGMTEELVDNAWHDGSFITIAGETNEIRSQGGRQCVQHGAHINDTLRSAGHSDYQASLDG
jgi:hypothetical protein